MIAALASLNCHFTKAALYNLRHGEPVCADCMQGRCQSGACPASRTNTFYKVCPYYLLRKAEFILVLSVVNGLYTTFISSLSSIIKVIIQFLLLISLLG